MQMKWFPLCLALLSGLGLAVAQARPATAQTAAAQTGVQADTVAEAERLILAGQTGAALDLLMDYRAQSPEDEARRLWAIAIALSRDRRPRAALPYLERLVSLAPGVVNYRLELAATLAAVGEDDRARHHFTLARGGDLSSATEAAVARQMDSLDRRKSWEGFFRFALTPESNAAKRTAAEVILINGLPFVLDPSSREEPANGISLGFGATLLPQLGRDLKGKAGLQLDAKLYDGRASDDVTLRADLGLLHFGDSERRISGGVSARHRWIDDGAYSATYGAHLAYSRRIGPATSLGLQLDQEWTDYDQPGTVGTQHSILSLTVAHAISPKLQLKLAASLDHASSRNSLESGMTAGLTLGGQYAFDGGLLLGLEAMVSESRRDGISTLFGARREDTRQMLTLKLTNRNWVVRGFAPVLELGLDRQRSTIPIYAYDNARAAIGFTRNF